MALKHHLPREDGPTDEYGDPLYTPRDPKAEARVQAWREQVERRSRAPHPSRVTVTSDYYVTGLQDEGYTPFERSRVVAPLPEDHPAKGFCE